jgi:hypothetical protein
VAWAYHRGATVGQNSTARLFVPAHLILNDIPTSEMEDDRAEVDLGIAVDVEERLEEEAAAHRQPKKRFVGRRQANEAASRSIASGAVGGSSAIQGKSLKIHIRWPPANAL